MAFRFTLDAVLRFRESVEHSEEAALASHRAADYRRLNANCSRLTAEQVRIREQREQDLALKLPAAHLLEIAERELELKVAADGLRLRLRQLETQRAGSSWPSIKPRARTARSSANCESGSAMPTS